MIGNFWSDDSVVVICFLFYSLPCMNYFWNSYLAFLFLKVLVTNNPGKIKVYVATDLKEPLTLHWGLSKKSMEWMVRCCLGSSNL